MNQEYIKPDQWSIIEEGFDPTLVKSSESLFSIGNGAMGQRANFEEDYGGATFQGSYIAGVYYPDKTRVGWWKNGYPEYFAKVLNAPNWIGIRLSVNGENFDLNNCSRISDFKRELNMQEGWYRRSLKATLQNGVEIELESTRILHLELDQLGTINYQVKLLNRDAEVVFSPYLDAGITNEDSNWDDKFWDIKSVTEAERRAFIHTSTMKTDFQVCTFMESKVFTNDVEVPASFTSEKKPKSITHNYRLLVEKGQTATLQKFAGYAVSLDKESSGLNALATQVLNTGFSLGYENLKEQQKNAWTAIWDMADIVIEGDIKAQQGIRFNIFQLNQTYLGKDARLNIGPKGFTGEKYGGSTYWDTEAYCIPFYMATKDPEVARNLLTYRYRHLGKAIENAEKLGFTNGAALYPMVTMNGEECHNEWEITFEEIHRNGAIAFAIYNYTRYTNDLSYIPEMGLEVLIGIARFWHQRATFSKAKNQYVILGVTGPNEYENNINNNFYTNYIAVWCMTYAKTQIATILSSHPDDHHRVWSKTNLSQQEIDSWMEVASQMYLPFDAERNIYLQQDGFLDKELITVSELDQIQRPINQKWSWDRILRSPYIKQADTLQGFYLFEEDFTNEELERHFDFYEPFTVHESSLSPCVHSIQAAKLGRMEQAYEFYLRTSRLDLDDYNKEVEEGCHITSMAGTWMSIVEGFGGMRVRKGMLHFEPRIPSQWDRYTFKVNFRGSVLKVAVTKEGHQFNLDAGAPISIVVNNETVSVAADT
ncbi:MAG: glycoside hydrolase family 65 protein [Bacteroidota bacterium]